MSSAPSRTVWLVALLVVLFVIWPREAAGFGGHPDDGPAAEAVAGPETQARLSEGFKRSLSFFEQHDLSLLVAWRDMRASGDPSFFERAYPGISRELDAWASSLEQQFGVEGPAATHMDFTFLLDELAPVALDNAAVSLVRDNAVATISLVCLMDSLR